VSTSEEDYTVGSGNIFADLGLADPGELETKAALIHEIASVARARHLTQSEAARILGTTQPAVSDLFAGRMGGFSIERLLRFLNAFDQDVRILVSPKPDGREKATVEVAGAVTALSARRAGRRSDARGDRALEA